MRGVDSRMHQRRNPGRLVPLFMAVVALLTTSASFSLALWRLSRPEDRKPVATSRTWRGLWPQGTRPEAARAQSALDRTESASSWQTAIDAEPVFLSYAREVLEWNRPALLFVHIPEGRDWVRQALVIRCAPGPHPDFPQIDCGLPRNRTYAAVKITAERLIRPDPGGIWIVTRVEPTHFLQPAPPSKWAVRAVVSDFLEGRVEGAGAEAYLSAEARHEFGNKAQLGPLYSGYAHYEIEFADGPSWPLGGFELGVRLFPAGGGADEETLFVGTTSGFSNEKHRLLVMGGRPGLSGP